MGISVYLKPFVMGGVMVSLSIIGYGYQKINQGPWGFESTIKPQLDYPIKINDNTTLTYSAVNGYNVLFNIETLDPYDDKAMKRYQQAMFGSFKNTQYCHPVKMMSYHEVVLITRIYFAKEDKEILLKNDITYLCGINVITGNIK